VSWYSASVRVAGWREALHRAGAPVHEPLAGDWTSRAGYHAGLELAERPDVTAVFAANDQMATGLMRAFKEKGRQIPEDVSIVGFDDAPDSEFLMVSLTTVRQDFTAITQCAVTQLVRAIAGEEFNRGLTRIPVDLVIRASSGPAPTPTSVG
jgi:DNA-binding LacI/PurR family transcriptional regulator